MIDTHQDGIVSVDEFLAFVGSDLGWLTTRQVCVCVCVWLGRMIGLCVCVCVARPHDRVLLLAADTMLTCRCVGSVRWRNN